RLGSDAAALAEARPRNISVLGYEGIAVETDGHGELTAGVLAALKEDGDLVADGIVTARELEAFATMHVLQHSNGQQFVRSYAQGENFPIASVPKRNKIVQAPATGEAVRGSTLATAPAAAEPTPAARRDFALLIGIDEYDHFKKLANPVDDVESIAKELREVYGFETEVLRNSSQKEVLEAMRALTKRQYGPQDQLLVFIAGHGEYVELGAGGEGYLIARDSIAQSDGGVNPLSHANVRQILQNVPVSHLLVLLDSCFSGTFDPAFSSGGARGDVYEDAPRAGLMLRNLKLKAKWWITSGGKEYVSDGVPKNHSPFARKLLESLRGYGG